MSHVMSLDNANNSTNYHLVITWCQILRNIFYLHYFI